MGFLNEKAGGSALLTLGASQAMDDFKAQIQFGSTSKTMPPQILSVFRNPGWVPGQVIAIDGSTVSAPLTNGFPGADASLLKVSIVSIDLHALNDLDDDEIPDPLLFGNMEKTSTFDAVLPGANVVRKGLSGDSPSKFFRHCLHKLLQSKIDEDWESLGDTLNAIEGGRHDVSQVTCPIEGCRKKLARGEGEYVCQCERQETIYEADSLRFIERFNETGSNGEPHGEVRHLIEVLALFNVLRYFAVQPGLHALRDTVFILDGPLAMFGHAAWLTKYILDELRRINDLCLAEGFELALFGYEKSGQFVNHFEMLDFCEENGPRRAIKPQTAIGPSADYINTCITMRPKGKVHGQDTYFGRKVLYKTRSGDHAVVTIAILNDDGKDFRRNDVACYPRLADCLDVLDHLSTYLYHDGFVPLIRAHAHAAIPLHRGTSILRDLVFGKDAKPTASTGPAGRIVADKNNRP